MNKLYFSLSLTLMFFMGAYSQENFKLPNHELMTLKNGLQIYLVQQDEVPLIHFKIRSSNEV